MPITLIEYQEQVKQFKKYPDLYVVKEGDDKVSYGFKFGYVYPALALNEEVNEICEEFLMAGEEVNCTALAKEIGDCMWMLAMLCNETGLNMIECFEAYAGNSTFMEEDHLDNLAGGDLVYVLVISSGYVSKMFAKSIRDYNGELAEKYHKPMVATIGRMIFALNELNHDYGFGSMEDVLQQNIEKLSDRQERGVLQGDGSTR